MTLNYNYAASKAYCEQIGLMWLGDEFSGLINMDADAHKLGLTQEQVDTGMRHHLWQIKMLFECKNYRWYQRLAIAFYFLTGVKKKNG